jgi:hypothetical protein
VEAGGAGALPSLTSGLWRPATAKRLRCKGEAGMAGRAAHRATLAARRAQAVPPSPVSASSHRQRHRSPCERRAPFEALPLAPGGSYRDMEFTRALACQEAQGPRPTVAPTRVSAPLGLCRFPRAWSPLALTAARSSRRAVEFARAAALLWPSYGQAAGTHDQSIKASQTSIEAPDSLGRPVPLAWSRVALCLGYGRR